MFVQHGCVAQRRRHAEPRELDNSDEDEQNKADRMHSSNIILGVYLIIFCDGKEHQSAIMAHRLTDEQALLCLSSRSLSRLRAMPPSCSPSLAVVSVCTQKVHRESLANRAQSMFSSAA
jgi:hypothetical protein